MTSIPLRVFVLGLLWAMLSSLAPVGVILLDWTTRWSDPPDWTMVWHVAATCAVGGGISFWRKHVALLKLPPDLEAAKHIAFDGGKDLT